MDKLAIYKMILEIISQDNPQDFQALLDDSRKYQSVKNFIASDEPNLFLIQDMQESVINMIEAGLISGQVNPMKYVTLITLNGLTAEGFQYLKKLREEETEKKIKAIIKSNNQALNAQTVTEALSSLIF
ncbi:hypothetical protein [Companilactobacillus sp. FL22-1]|uniref:hypothetical protein n=1 Tax=Companilactobacillus sp. FL22-1 TaxID=3373892 RepID=UPI003753FB47